MLCTVRRHADKMKVTENLRTTVANRERIWISKAKVDPQTEVAQPRQQV